MEIELRALLRANAELVALVGSRIDWGERRQGAPLPAITMMVVDGAEGLHMKGSNQLWQGRVQIDCYGETYGDAKRVANIVRDLLHGYRADRFRLIQILAERDHRKIETNEADKDFRVGLDFKLAWRTE